MSTLGYCKKGLEARQSPTIKDIYWVAGLYEGEGSCGYDDTTRAHIWQADRWILDNCCKLFGGSITTRPKRNMEKKIPFVWSISGARARGFLMTIYSLLSPRRKKQVEKVLKGKLNDG